MSNSLQLHGLQHVSFLCPSLSPGVCSNSSPLSQWCHPTISSSVASFSSSNRVFSSGSALHIMWPKCWSFSISPSNEYSRLISFRIDWLGLHLSTSLDQWKDLWFSTSEIAVVILSLSFQIFSPLSFFLAVCPMKWAVIKYISQVSCFLVSNGFPFLTMAPKKYLFNYDSPCKALFQVQILLYQYITPLLVSSGLGVVTASIVDYCWLSPSHILVTFSCPQLCKEFFH